MLFYDLLDLLWLWYTSFLIVMHKLDLLMFHVQSFCCFKHSGVIFGIFYFSYEVFCSFFSGISNFLIHLFEYLFPWFSQLFVLLWVFAIFNLESYFLLFFWHPFKVWIWYLVVIYFLLVSDMSFCCAFNYFLGLFPFVILLWCYVRATLSFLFNLLSISFLVFFILCKLSSVDLCWASFDDKFLPISVLFWQRQVWGPTMFLSLHMNVHRSGLACSFDSE